MLSTALHKIKDTHFLLNKLKELSQKSKEQMKNYKTNENNKNVNDKVLLKLNFKRFLSDPCVYIKKDENNNIKCLLAVYVDDIIVAGTSEEVNKTKSLIKDNFEATDVGEVDYIIGIKICYIQRWLFFTPKEIFRRYIKLIWNKQI